MIRIGFHVSIAGSVANAPRAAVAEGYGAFQIFTTSSRSWKNSELDDDEVGEFRRIVDDSEIVPFAHIPYLCNPSSTNPEMHRKSVGMLINNLNNCHTLGIGALVIHLGSHLGKGPAAGEERLLAALNHALESTESVRILLENTSGYKNSMGSKFEDIGRFADTVGSDRIGVCFDTCHAFAAGYDLRDGKGVDDTLDSFDDSIGLGRLGLVHLNDAKNPLGSGLDRHWHIGKGEIGLGGFRALLSDKRMRDRCFVMETPINEDGGEEYNLRTVEKIIESVRG
ncbi:MAG: deoxyribonuclease IV [Candidatus Micrarchaeota archaeon]|nr:deoxyribonuclease IV [Candidatus Micrarchaeota archaeon]